MSRRKSIVEVREMFYKGGVEPLFKEYISANTPLRFRCICGEEDNISVSSLNRSLKNLGNLRCKKCRNEKVSKGKILENKERILNRFQNIEILDIVPGVHAKSIPKIIFKCPMCGEKSSIYYKKDLELLLCKECRDIMSSEKQRLPQAEVKELFEKGGAILLSQYEYANQKLIFQCKCGEIGSIILTNLKYKGVKPLCKRCQLECSYPRGEKSPNWNPELSEWDRLSWGRSSEDKQWYRKIFERFNYTCFISGKRNIPLSAHHLYQYSKYPELRLDLENGVCLSRELHLEFHKRYSYTDSSIEDFCDFFEDKTGENFREYYNLKTKHWGELKMKTFTLDEAREFVRKCGAEPLFDFYINSYTDYLVRCSCGNEEKIKFSTLGRNIKKDVNYKYRCSKCRNLGRPVHTVESLKNDFIKYMAEPLFDKYEGLRKELKYRCECGRISFVTCEQFYMRVKKYEDYKLLCKSCACKKASGNKVGDFFNKIIKPYFEEREIKLLSENYENNHTPLKFLCHCGNESEVTWLSLNINGSLKCNECALKDRPRGENHPDWNPLLTDEDRIESVYGRTNKVKIWSKLLLRLNNYTCCITGQVGGNLVVHHLNAWSKYKDQRYTIFNGVVLSRELHNKFHKEFGMRGDNTLEQFKVFYRRESGRKFNIPKNIYAEIIFSEEESLDILNKKRQYAEKGINYLPLFQNEIVLKSSITLSILRAKLGYIQNKYYARNFEIKEIKDNSERKFLEENHRQGVISSRISLGLFNNEGELMSVMIFGIPRFGRCTYELLRFCSKLNTIVIGGASKLFEYFKDNFEFNSIISYADIRFSDLNPDKTVYKNMGFKYSHLSKPNYWYTKDGINLYSRIRFQKHKLKDKLEKFDNSLSERENMLLNGYQRLYDCGNHVFVYER